MVGNRTVFVQILRSAWVGLACMLLAACAGKSSRDMGTGKRVETVDRYREERPGWTMTPPSDDDTYHYFVGISGYHATEQEALADAMRDARMKFAKFTGVEMKNQSKMMRVYFGLSSDVQDPTESGMDIVEEDTTALVKNLRQKEGYWEKQRHYEKGAFVQQSWQYWVLVTVPQAEVERVEAWRKEQEAEAEKTVDEIAAISRKRCEEIEGIIVQGRPLEALAKVEVEYKRLMDSARQFKDRGWPYDKEKYVVRMREAQSAVKNLAEESLDSIRIDTGRYSGTYYLRPGKATQSIQTWAYSKRANQPLENMPLAFLTTQYNPLARAQSGPGGGAVFTVNNLEPGEYLVAVDVESSQFASLEEGTLKALAGRANRIRILPAPESVEGIVLLTVRDLFEGPAHMPFPAQSVSLGPVTFVTAREEKDSRQGGVFALMVKDEIRQAVSGLGAVKVMETRTRSLSAVEKAVKTRDIMNRGMNVKPELQSASVQALIDGAEAALNCQYTVYGRTLRLMMELKKAGMDQVLASCTATFPLNLLPAGIELLPEQMAAAGVTFKAPRPIQVEVSSNLGDGQTYKAGEEVVYFFTTNRDSYLLLIYEDAKGKLLQVLPNSYESRAFYQAGAMFQIPDASSRFAFVVGPPFGSERLWAFASNQPFPDLPGQMGTAGKMLNLSLEQNLDILRGHAVQPGVFYGENQTVLTTVPK